MTRVDKNFSDHLLQNLQRNDGKGFDLRASNALFGTPHPLVLKAQLNHEINPQQDYPNTLHFMGWNLFCFKTINEVADTSFLKAHPFQIFNVLRDKPNEVCLDFEDLGCVKLTHNKILEPTVAGLHQNILPLVLNYCFSADLWGKNGKWNRFHQRLIGVFEKYELASGGSLPGYYPLNKKACSLQSLGIKGDESGGRFSLTLPWTFSLSNLDKLEKIIEQEF